MLIQLAKNPKPKMEKDMSKKTYLCIQRSQPGDGSSEKPSPAQMEKMFASFNAWKEKFKDNIPDMGGKLGEGAVVTSEGATISFRSESRRDFRS